MEASGKTNGVYAAQEPNNKQNINAVIFFIFSPFVYYKYFSNSFVDRLAPYLFSTNAASITDSNASSLSSPTWITPLSKNRSINLTVA